MKKNILSVLAAVLLFASCDKFLEEDPKGTISEKFSQTAEGAESATLSIYETNRDLAESLIFFGVCGTDLFTYGTQGNFNDRVPAACYNNNVIIDNSNNYSFWKRLYNSVNVCNYAIQSIGKSDASDTQKSDLVAETKALRAFYYWLLVETYGPGVHLSILPTTEPATIGFQPGETEVYKLIISDINEALSRPLSFPNQPGRLNEGIIKALKANILLSLAGHDDAIISAVGLTQQQCYEQASILCEDVKTKYGYQLLDKFEDVYSPYNQLNKEIIWAIQYTPKVEFNTGQTNNWHKYFVPQCNRSARTNKTIAGLQSHSLYYGREYRWIMPTMAAIQFYPEYDLRKKGTFQTVWMRQPDANLPPIAGDTVLIRKLTPVTDEEINAYAAKGIVLDGLNHVYDIATGVPTLNGRSIYNTLLKHLDPTRTFFKDENSYKDLSLIRLGDIYMMQAEAEFHLGNKQKAADIINNLRVRAIKPGYSSQMHVADSDITLDFILDEHARETAGEAFRWFVLKRNGALVSRVKQYNPDCAGDIKEYHVNRPIPQTELNAITNYPIEFKQNPGY